MIVLDTHIWVWWIDESPRLSDRHQRYIEQHRATGVGVSAMSCWEVAKLVEKGRLGFALSVGTGSNAPCDFGMFAFYPCRQQ